MYETLLLEQSLRAIIRERDELRHEMELLKGAALDVMCSDDNTRDENVRRLCALLGASQDPDEVDASVIDDGSAS